MEEESNGANIRGVIVSFFPERVSYVRADLGTIVLSVDRYHPGKAIELAEDCVLGVYSEHGRPMWERKDMKRQDIELQGGHKGLCMTLSNVVIYRGEIDGKHYFRMVEGGTAMEPIPKDVVQAIYSSNGRKLWENVELFPSD